MKPVLFALLVVGVLSVVLFGMLVFVEVPWEFLSPTLLGIGATITAAALWALGYAFARGLEQTTPDRLTLAYFLVLVIVLPGAVVLEMCVLAALRVFGRPPAELILAMNIIPAFIAGWLFYTPFGSHVVELNRQQAASWRHFRRCFGLYLSALLFGVFIAAGARSPGFWLIGQLFLWPLCAVLGGSEPTRARTGCRVRRWSWMPNGSLEPTGRPAAVHPSRYCPGRPAAQFKR